MKFVVVLYWLGMAPAYVIDVPASTCSAAKIDVVYRQEYAARLPDAVACQVGGAVVETQYGLKYRVQMERQK